MFRRGFLAVLGVGITGCLGSDTEDEDGGDTTGIFLNSPAFDDGEVIPTEHTCEGENVSPPLRVDDAPEEAETLALVVDDPDAKEVAGKVWVHWLLWNVPADTEEIPRAVSQGGTVEEIEGALQGTNDSDEIGYSGPCPPEGDGPHTYRFFLYAVDTELKLEAGAERGELEDALDGVTVAEARLDGTYER